MGAVRSEPEQIQALMEKGPDGPIVMVNTLKFRERAIYSADKPEAQQSLSGRDAYQRYGDAVMKYLAEAGAQLVWQGRQSLIVVGDDDQNWDEVLCVRYPSRDAFLKMVMNPGYVSIAHHRDAALEHSGLLCCEAGSAA